MVINLRQQLHKEILNNYTIEKVVILIQDFETHSATWVTTYLPIYINTLMTDIWKKYWATVTQGHTLSMYNKPPAGIEVAKHAWFAFLMYSILKHPLKTASLSIEPFKCRLFACTKLMTFDTTATLLN